MQNIMLAGKLWCYHHHGVVCHVPTDGLVVQPTVTAGDVSQLSQRAAAAAGCVNQCQVL